MLNPRKTNVALDANALDRDGGKRDAFVDRFNALVASGTATVVVPGGVRGEVQHQHTPSDVQDAILPQIFNWRTGLNSAQQEERRRLAVILQGNAKPGSHAADASHISEAAETGCAYFITEDNRILRKRAELRRALPPTLEIVTLTEFFEAFDRSWRPEPPQRWRCDVSGWVVVFHNLTRGGEKARDRTVPSKGAALIRAGDLMRQGHTVTQIQGPNGEVIGEEEIRRLVAANPK
jgi:hypothetical protein